MVPVEGNRSRRTAASWNSGSISRSAARCCSCSIFAQSSPWRPNRVWRLPAWIGEPGPHQSRSEVNCFQRIQIFRSAREQVLRGKPMATAKRSAPSPTSMTWPVRSMTALQTIDTFLMSRRRRPNRRARAAVHGGVEFDHAFLVRQAVEATLRLGIVFGPPTTRTPVSSDVAAALEKAKGSFHVGVAVVGTNNNWALGGDRSERRAALAACGGLCRSLGARSHASCNRSQH